MGLACFDPSGLSIILENNSEGQKEQRHAQAPFLYIAAAVCEEPAVIFTAPGLLAISFCIDSLSKAIDFQPAAQVCEARGRKTENPSPLKFMFHHFLSPNSLGFQDILRCRHQG